MQSMLTKYVLNIGFSKLSYCSRFNIAGGQNTVFLLIYRSIQISLVMQR